MIKFIDNFLNRITMYRLVLYYLTFLWVIALILSIFNILPYQPLSLILELFFIISVSWVTNNIFAWTFKTPTNVESLYITAFILALIIVPFQPTGGFGYLLFLFWASVWAMASKFILAIRKKHIFNPAAIAVVLTAFLLNQSAFWWVGQAALWLFVFLGGLLIVRKIKRFSLVFSFILAAFFTITGASLLKGTSPIIDLERAIFQSPIFFFAFIMLTEPLTTPPTKILQICYGLLVGFLFSPAIHIGSVYSTPELALITGNIFSYLVSPKQKLLLTLREKLPVGKDMYDFVFDSDEKLNFRPGQYLEWTMGHDKPDSRGNRRYFTIASSPTELDIRAGIKFYPEGSSFKRALLSMKPGDDIIATQLAGEFVLPKDIDQKLVFIAGGIGVTPFRSMIRYLLDNHEKRDIVLFYSNKTVEEIAYKNIFDRAEKDLGIRTIYTITGQTPKPIPFCRYGRLDGKTIEGFVPDCLDRVFYLSGPHAMVEAYKKTLTEMGVPRRQIKTDFFPGFV